MVMSSGLVAVDRYVADQYLNVRGMSSSIAALVAAATMRIQSDAGIIGDAMEIGVFEGRFFIALCLALCGDEKAIGIDLFDWPDDGVRDRLEANLARFEVAERAEIMRGDSTVLLAREAIGSSGSGTRVRRPRFIHIDGDHKCASLAADLRLALDCIDPRGVICLDDMLHPGYPDLYSAVQKVLAERPGWIIFCIVDRESIVAAAKFMICDTRAFEFYTQRLAYAFYDQIWRMGGQFETHKALVLAAEPTLPKIIRKPES